MKAKRLRSGALAGVTLVGVGTSEIGVGDIILIGVGAVAGLDALHNLSDRGGNTMSATASGDPPVPDATPGDDTKGRTSQWEKSGGQAQADKDFDNLHPTNVRPIPGGRTGTLPDGRSVNVRGSSSDGRPTLEIQDGSNRIKVRYSP